MISRRLRSLLGTALCCLLGLDARAAPTLTTLVSFGGTSGCPVSPLTFDLFGELFGANGCGSGPDVDGAVFKLSGPDHRTLTTVFHFDGTGAGQPGPLIFDLFGDLYGTAAGGRYGGGVAFELSGPEHRVFADLTDFDQVDGPYSSPGLTFAAAGLPYLPGVPALLGNLFGTTQFGGASGRGTLFELSGSNHRTSTTLHDFTAGYRGQEAAPQSPLVADAAGNLFGATTTTAGTYRYGYGSVFEVSGRDHRTFTTLAYFDGPDDGYMPIGGLTFDKSGNLYGTTIGAGPHGGGTVYELAGPDHTTLTRLAAFDYSNPFQISPGGSAPEGTLVIDAAGNLFGTTAQGGLPSPAADGTFGMGVIFRLAADHRTLTVLHRFTGGADGAYPGGTLIADLAGNLYGTTGPSDANPYGTVFELSGAGFVPFYPSLIKASGPSVGD